MITVKICKVITTDLTPLQHGSDIIIRQNLVLQIVVIAQPTGGATVAHRKIHRISEDRAQSQHYHKRREWTIIHGVQESIIQGSFHAKSPRGLHQPPSDFG